MTDSAALIEDNRQAALPGLLQCAARLIAEAQSTKAKMRLIWSVAKEARRHAADEEIEAELLALARRCSLIDASGWYNRTDVREGVRRYGAEDVQHVIRWGLRGWNAFEKGPLQ